MQPADSTGRLHRRATVFKLSRYLDEVGLRINPEAMLRDMEGMQEISSGPTHSEVTQILGELQKLADASRRPT